MSTDGGLLDRPDDKPSPHEDAAVERAARMTWKQRRELAGTLSSLENSRKRCLAYLNRLQYDDYGMERRVQSRLLDRFLILQPSILQMTLEEACERADRAATVDG